MKDRNNLDFSISGLRKRIERHLREVSKTEVSGDHQLNPILGRADHRMDLRDAAVLIPIVDRGEGATVMLTHRTNQLPTHAGQVAFPGGKVEKDDPDEIATAIRECEEEIGLDKKFISPLRVLPPYLAFSGFRIVPVLAVVSGNFSLSLNRNEVDAVFEVPLSFLMTSGNHKKQSRKINGALRYYYAMPYQDHFIWGVTAGIIRSLYERVYAEC